MLRDRIIHIYSSMYSAVWSGPVKAPSLGTNGNVRSLGPAVGESPAAIAGVPPGSVTVSVFHAWAGEDQQQMRPLTNSSGHGRRREETFQRSPPGDHLGWAWIWRAPGPSDTLLPRRKSEEIKGMGNISDGPRFLGGGAASPSY